MPILIPLTKRGFLSYRESYLYILLLGSGIPRLLEKNKNRIFVNPALHSCLGCHALAKAAHMTFVIAN